MPEVASPCRRFCARLSMVSARRFGHHQEPPEDDDGDEHHEDLVPAPLVGEQQCSHGAQVPRPAARPLLGADHPGHSRSVVTTATTVAVAPAQAHPQPPTGRPPGRPLSPRPARPAAAERAGGGHSTPAMPPAIANESWAASHDAGRQRAEVDGPVGRAEQVPPPPERIGGQRERLPGPFDEQNNGNAMGEEGAGGQRQPRQSPGPPHLPGLPRLPPLPGLDPACPARPARPDARLAASPTVAAVERAGEGHGDQEPEVATVGSAPAPGPGSRPARPRRDCR